MAKDKDKDKDKKEKKGFLGRFFGAKKDEAGPATPQASGDPEDAATIPPDSPATPAADFSPDGATIDSNELPADMATIPPGYIKNPPKAEKPEKGKKTRAPATPVLRDDPNDLTMAPMYAQGRAPATPAGGNEAADLTMPPGYAKKGAPATPPGATDLDLTMPPGYVMPSGGDPGIDLGEMTMAPSYAKPQRPGTPNDLAMTMPPGYVMGDFGGAGGTDPAELTMAPSYARPGAVAAGLGDDPFANPGGGDQDLMVTNDPDLAVAPRTPASADPFGFGPGDDLLGAAPGVKKKPSDTFGFGEDVVDLLAPSGGAPSGGAPATADPFGAPLTDDPYEGGAKPPAPPAPPRPTGHKTEPLEAAAGIDVFEVELEGDAPAAAPAKGEISQDEVTMEMERPAAAAPKGFHNRATNRLDAPALAEDGAASLPRRALTEPAIEIPPVARTLFGSKVAQPEGGWRLSEKAAEVVFDEATKVLFAPPVTGGWSDLPEFVTTLADGSVVGKLPRGASTEDGGVIVVPAAGKARAWQPDEASGGRRAEAFPAGVVVDRESRVAYASPEVAPTLGSSPEPRLRTDDGAVVFFVPEGATFDESGGYTLPAAPASSASAKVAEPAPSVGPDHPAHGAAVWKSSYFGCEEVVYADGWGSVRLPTGSKIERDWVLLPPKTRTEAGAPPALLDVVRRPDGWLQLPIPEGFLPEGDLVWIAPTAESDGEVEGDASSTEASIAQAARASIAQAARASIAQAARAWGEPTERLSYAGIEDSLYSNGWVRLDLPPGATVTRNRLRLPREYANAADAATLAAFDREPDGALACDLPETSEILGSVVLIPPAGEVSGATGSSSTSSASSGSAPAEAPAPESAGIARPPRSTSNFSKSKDASSSEASSEAASKKPATQSFKSAAPPDGGDLSRPGATRSLDRFRPKKDEAKSDLDESKPDEVKSESSSDEAKSGSDESKPDEVKSESSGDEAKSDSSESKPDEVKSESSGDEAKSDSSEPKPDEVKGDADADSNDGGAIRRPKKRKK